jgi:hypothetical protein
MGKRRKNNSQVHVAEISEELFYKDQSSYQVSLACVRAREELEQGPKEGFFYDSRYLS